MLSYATIGNYDKKILKCLASDISKSIIKIEQTLAFLKIH